MADRLLKSLRSEKAFTVLLLIPILAVLFAYVLYPSFRTLAESLTAEGRFSLEHYRQFFSPETLTNLEALWNSLYISVLSVLLSGLVGVPLAFIFNRYDFPGRSFFAAAAVLPIVLPPLVGVMSFLFLYGESGLITRTLQSLLGLDEPPFRLGGVSGILAGAHLHDVRLLLHVRIRAIHRNRSGVEEAATTWGPGADGLSPRHPSLHGCPPSAAAALFVFMTSMASFRRSLLSPAGFRVLTPQIFIAKLNGASGDGRHRVGDARPSFPSPPLPYALLPGFEAGARIRRGQGVERPPAGGAKPADQTGALAGGEAPSGAIIPSSFCPSDADRPLLRSRGSWTTADLPDPRFSPGELPRAA